MTNPTDAPVLAYSPSVAPQASTPLSRWVRAASALTCLTLWCMTSMWHASPGTTWEHHPHGGPFILLKHALDRGAMDICTITVWVLLLAPLFHWIWTGRIWSGVVTAVVAGSAFVLGHFVAMTAGC
jgi:hypothetical protein